MPPSLPSSICGLHMLFMNTQGMCPGASSESQCKPLLTQLSQCSQDIGYTFGIRFLFQARVTTADPENLKAILATEFDGFEKGAEFRGLMEPLLGTGVFHRQMTRPFFHRERISDLDLFDHHAENAIGQFKACLREGHAADFQDMVSRFPMDTASSLLFGQDVRSLDARLPYPYTRNMYTVTNASNVNAPAAQAQAHPSSAFATAFQDTDDHRAPHALRPARVREK
ncbi:hypothetical protein B0H19DRAFT_1072610 [Mycena capillaripes]|nr:hypothetical protein B0H19DRAFT_1072610 [Mycena capillaripes]